MIEQGSFRQLWWACLAFASGVAALCYEVLWLRRFGEFLGSTVWATQLVLAVFFGGMALGAVMASRAIKRDVTAAVLVRRYVLLEAVLACFGVLSPWLLDAMASWYFAGGSALFGDVTGLRSTLAIAFLLLPSACMGATLPLLVQLAQEEGEAKDRVAARLYLWNTLGAAFGAALAGLLLPRWLGIRGGLWYAASLNGFVAWVVWRHRAALLSVSADATPDATPVETADTGEHNPQGSSFVWLCLFAVSGFCAMAYEVLWARGLLSVLGNSIYSFSSILSVYLLGLALGGGCWRWLSRRFGVAQTMRRAGVAFGVLQGVLGCLGVASLWLLQELPLLKRALQRAWQPGGTTGLFIEWSLICALFLLPAICIGMLFPAMIGRTSVPGAGVAVGRVFAATTIGGVVAPLLVGLWWMPAQGLGASLWAIGAINLLLGAIALRLSSEMASEVRVGTILLLLGGMMLFVAPTKLALLPLAKGQRVLLAKEGLAASLAVVTDTSGHRRLKLNGSFSMGGAAGLFGEQRQGHLPRLLIPKARDVLVLGVGTGHTLAAMATHPTRSIDAVELVPGVLSLLPMFARGNRGIEKRKGVRLIVDDARHAMATTKKRYDLIAADLFHTYKAGVGGLYAREHFLRGRRKLRKDGCFWQWLPLHQLTPSALRVVLRTYLDVFPQVHAFLAYLNVETPALGLLGASKDFRLTPLSTPRGELRGQLTKAGFGSPLAVWSMYLADRKQLERFSRGARVNTEDRPWLELTLPLARWSPGWSKLGARNLALMVDWPLPKKWTQWLPKPLHQGFLRRSRSTRMYLKSRLAAKTGAFKRATSLLLLSARLDQEWKLPQQVLSNQASALIKAKRYRAAEVLLRRVLGGVPKNAEAWTLLANVHYLTGRPKRAIALYQKALSIAPGFWLALRNIAILLDKRGRSADALQLLLNATGRVPQALLTRMIQRIGKKVVK